MSSEQPFNSQSNLTEQDLLHWIETQCDHLQAQAKYWSMIIGAN